MTTNKFTKEQLERIATYLIKSWIFPPEEDEMKRYIRKGIRVLKEIINGHDIVEIMVNPFDGSIHGYNGGFLIPVGSMFDGFVKELKTVDRTKILEEFAESNFGKVAICDPNTGIAYDITEQVYTLVNNNPSQIPRIPLDMCENVEIRIQKYLLGIL